MQFTKNFVFIFLFNRQVIKKYDKGKYGGSILAREIQTFTKSFFGAILYLL